MKTLHVLYDVRCHLCGEYAYWLSQQEAFVEINPKTAAARGIHHAGLQFHKVLKIAPVEGHGADLFLFDHL